MAVIADRPKPGGGNPSPPPPANRPDGGLRRGLKVRDAAAVSIGLIGPAGATALLGVGAAALLGRAAPLALGTARPSSDPCGGRHRLPVLRHSARALGHRSPGWHQAV
jgi:hypothetical protein